jgi:hypothetical protein
VWCESGKRVEGGRSESRSLERVGSGPFVVLLGVGVRGTCICGLVSLFSGCALFYTGCFSRKEVELAEGMEEEETYPMTQPPVL